MTLDVNPPKSPASDSDSMPVEPEHPGVSPDEPDPVESVRLTAPLSEIAITLSGIGAVISAFTLLSAALPGADAGSLVFLMAFAGWAAAPYLVTAVFASAYRKHRTSSWMILLASVLGIVIGVGLPIYVMYFSKPDAQGALVFLVAPFWHFLLVTPFLVAVFVMGRALKKQEGADWQTTRP